MKRLFLLLVLLMVSQASWAQQPLTTTVGLQQQLSLHRLTFRYSLIPTVGFQLQRHALAAGPVLLLKEFPSAANSLPQLTGLLFAYEYDLTAKAHRKVQLFAEVNIKGQLFTEEWSSNYWDPSAHQYKDVTQKSQEWLLENYAGLGVRYPITPRLHIQTSGLLGYSFSEQRRIGNSPVPTDNTSDYRPYKDKGLIYALNLGIYYSLK